MTKTTEMKQVRLQCKDGDTMPTLTTWVDNNPRIKIGAQVQLKEDERWWTVLAVYEPVLSRSEVESNRNWDNNNYDKHESSSLKTRLKK